MEQNLSNFQSQSAELSAGLQAKMEKSQESFKKKFTGDEVAKTLGEVKSFMSGKPVTQYLLKKGGKYVDDATESLSNKFNDFFADTPAEAPIEMEEFEGFDAVDGVGGGAVAPAAGGGGAAAVDYLDVAPNAVDDAAGGYLDVAPNAAVPDAAASSYLDVAANPVIDDVLIRSSDPLADVGGGAVTSSTLAGPLAPPAALEEGVLGGAEAGEAGAGIEEGLATVSGVLDSIPGADILGLALGIGLTVGSIIKKPKMASVKDTVNSSYQIGI